ncbi:putative transposase [Vigna unguiculata]|uniref:Putative transposase n=1 Tax=Vigna unguiculata TaxID=3917 RepID=A0A4D6LD54_VIGUN|nr:putative transposase [Vigna unguiculata]
MSQLMQEAWKDLEKKPIWMGEDVWAQLKAYWKSSSFKSKSETNKRNRVAMDGASLHTGGSIPHRLHWKRMKEEKGANPSLTEFYFRTHRRKKDESWVGLHAKLAFDKFEQRKSELTSQSHMENANDGKQSIHEYPSDWDIWIDSVGKKRGRIFGL